ncbi:CHAT domain-containing protein [Bradyrhizobium sp. HKCCYLRH1030]|uniref:CHAT domain-containing protein n=1 Tax=Bradyrhizobium sp. HKCCYLRH1030 TaxID=3420744 RepID=UPI003EBFD6A3
MALLIAVAPAMGQAQLNGDPETSFKSVVALLQQAGATRDNDEQIRLLEEVIARVVAMKEWPRAMPREVWLGLIRHSLGKHYMVRTTGEPADNVDHAIALFEAVQDVLDIKRDPRTWVENHVQLGQAYIRRLNGDRQQNLKKASDALEPLRSVLDRTRTPELWASVMSNLGYVYSRLVLGGGEHNIDRAIADIAAADTVFTKENYPEAWAVNQSTLGEALSHRTTGSRVDNLQKAIAANEAAESVFDRSTDPRWALNEFARGTALLALSEQQRDAAEANRTFLNGIAALEAARELIPREDYQSDWVTLRFVLAGAYRKRTSGSPADADRRAITNYEEFLAAASRERDPMRWAAANADLAHLLLSAGATADNVERAIRLLREASTVYTHADFPDAWGQLQAALGLAYFLRREGDPAENLEVAISSYQTALATLRPESNIPKWGDVQNNYGGALLARVRGVHENNLRQAVAAFKAALTIRTLEHFPRSWAETQANLGRAYSDMEDGDRGANIDAAVAAFEAAQTVFTRASDPVEWANSAMRIGSLLLHHPRDPASKVERAITSLEASGEVYARQAHPREWAFIETYLGSAYRDRYSGSKLRNLEQSIQHYEAALSVLSRNSDPRGWAQAMNGRGMSYIIRIEGSKKDNIDAALKCFDEAQSVYTRQAAPLDWAMVQNNRGLALVERSADQASIDTAIDAYKDAIAVYDEHGSRQLWAETQGNLGLALKLRISGSRADNIEASIAAFEAALEATSKEQYPDFWATTQANLANSLLDRLHGVNADNVEQAIQRYQAALSIQTREHYPEDWARLQVDLGSAFRLRVWGNARQNLANSILAYQQALTVLTPDEFPQQWAFASMSLGHAYRSRSDDLDNVNKALSAYADAAKIYRREQDPDDWAILETNIASAYLQIAPRVGYDQAELHLNAARPLLSPETRPREHLQVVHALGNVAAARSDWPQALAHYQDAIATFRLLFGMGLDQAEAREVISSSRSLFADAAFAAAKLGDLHNAFRLLEDGKARLLNLSLRIDSLKLSADERSRRDELLAKINNAERQYRLATGLRKASALTELDALRRQLADLIRSHDGEDAETDGAAGALDRVASLLREGRAIVAPVVTESGAMVLVATAARDGTIELSSHNAGSLDSRNLAEFVRGRDSLKELGGWFGAYQANYVSRLAGRQKWQTWFAAIDDLGPSLWTLIGSAISEAIVGSGTKPGAELIIVPQGMLGVVPIGMARSPKSGRRLMDDYVVTYAPSVAAIATIAERLRTLQSTAEVSLAAVINPTSDLRFSTIEGALVESNFPAGNRAVLEGDAATIDGILKAINGRSYWHFAGHGSFNWMDASAAGLLLKNEVLSVASLSQAPALGTPRLVVLSACETGLHDAVRTPDEFSGLPAAFLRIGAVGVISTLWPVNDISTAFLMAKFYDLHRKQSVPPARALQLAQDWIRQATLQDLRAYASAAVKDGRMSVQLASPLLNLRNKTDEEVDSTGPSDQVPDGTLDERRKPEQVPSGTAAAGGLPVPDRERPYAHPFYWGGFVMTGQ